MSLYGMMRTGVSGMDAQANRLSTVADNIANANTTGYKKFETLFSTQVVNQTAGSYYSGGVNATARQMVSQQGVLEFTNSGSDLAISGNGFFVVQDASGVPQLTRAGSFVANAEGELINAAGFTLMGYSFENGIPSTVANGFEGLEPVQISDTELLAEASTASTLTANLPSDAVIVTGTTAAGNLATSEYTSKTSIVAYDSLGGRKLLDVYFTKTADETWEVAVFDQADATADTSFPYASLPLTTQTLTFDPTNGQLDGASPIDFTFTVPDGVALTVNVEDMSQLATDFIVSEVTMDGNPPASIERVEFSADGTVYGAYTDGSTRAMFRIPIADVVSPDQLQSKTGNVFVTTAMSGDVQIGFANEGSNGGVVSGALEASTVDIAAELTMMIEAQRTYTANSKVFQTASELTEVVIGLKR